MYFGTGGKIMAISDDWKIVKLRLRLNLWTRNYVGTIFGGSFFAASDPFYMIMFMKILGNNYIVWDRGATIKFVKPGKEPLYADFNIDDVIIAEVKSKVDENGFYIWTMPLHWKTKDGIVICFIERQLYAATKEYYNSRK
jgi:hypothetical protein